MVGWSELSRPVNALGAMPAAMRADRRELPRGWLVGSAVVPQRAAIGDGSGAASPSSSTL